MNTAKREPRLENPMMTYLKLGAVCLCLALAAPIHAEEDSHDEHAEEAGGAIELSPDERSTAGLVVDTVARSMRRFGCPARS